MKEKIFNLKGEIWRDVVGYEGLYQVSNYGRVASLNYNKTGKWHLLSPATDKDGYLFVGLTKNHKTFLKKIHRLVAEAFPEICGEWFEGAEIDHINGIRDDNRAENLRWVTRSENLLNPISRKRKSELLINRKDQSKPVLQFTKDGTFIAEYQSISEAERQTGTAECSISMCCLKKRKSAGGNKWKFKEDYVGQFNKSA